MTEAQEIICKPTKWFLWRALAMVLMFSVGAFLFFKDWKWGYPEKNVERYYYLAFEAAEKSFKEHLENEGTPEEWQEMAAQQLVFIPHETAEDNVEKVEPTVPADTDLDTLWPEILVDFEGYSALYAKEEPFNTPPGWKDFSNSDGRKWGEKTDKLKGEKKIKEQLYIGVLCLALTLIALVILFRTLSGTLRVDEEGLYPPRGSLIPYASMKRLDTRKWDTKGLATVTYEKEGKEKKAKIDGMVYGQFKKEEGAPAEALYQQVLANFKGEIIEFVSEKEEGSEPSEEKEPAINDSE